MNSKNKIKKKDFKVSKNIRVDNQSIKHSWVASMAQDYIAE